MKIETIVILGAFDRFNYGDILFPLVLEHLITSRFADTKVVFVGLKEADLTSLGGVKTEKIDCLSDFGSDSVFIIAGGEVLGAHWFKLLRYLLPTWTSTPLRLMERIFPEPWLRTLAKQVFKSKHELPFVLDKKYLKDGVRIAYNSVGGTSFSTLSAELKADALENLAEAEYLSVRDRQSKMVLDSEQQLHDVVCIPDSAAVMRNVFKEEDLQHGLQSDVQQVISSNKKKYVFFQIGADHLRGNKEVIVSQIDATAKRTGMLIVLCPIGTAAGHDDQLANAHISERLGCPHKVIENPRVKDIMALIKNAAVYIGSSLHGTITALAWGTPYVPMSSNVPKLRAYLETWGVEELEVEVAYEEISGNTVHALAVSEDKIKERSDYCAGIYLQNAEDMFGSLGLKQISTAGEESENTVPLF